MYKYFEYGGPVDIENRGLTTGSYKSSWLADLVAFYVFDKAKNLFLDTTLHYGIYRDDGIVFLKGKLENEDVKRWLKTFQLKT